MPLVQLLKYRDMSKDGQAVLAEMAAALKDMPEPQGGVGRLHIEGKTIGDNPFGKDIRQYAASRGYKLDSLNWIYWKRFDDDGAALEEMEQLGEYRKTLDKTVADSLHFRVMQDPDLDEGWPEVTAF